MQILYLPLTFMLVALIGCGSSSSANQLDKNLSDSVAIDSVDYNSDSDTMTTSETFTPIKEFMVNSKRVTLPVMTDFDPIIEKMHFQGRKIKNIKIVGVTVSGGAADAEDMFESIRNANNYKEAEKSCAILSDYNFDSRGRVVSLVEDYGIQIKFSYDEEGEPTEILYSEDGYRGSPSYKIKHIIAWKAGKASDIKSSLFEYESSYDEKPSKELLNQFNFASDEILDNLNGMLKNHSTKIKVIGNTIRVEGKDSDGYGLVYWCKVECFD